MRIFIITFIISFIIINSSFSQVEDPTSTLFVCGTEEEPLQKSGGEKNSMASLGGKQITASGTIRALVVYIQFASEPSKTDYWLPGEPPTFMHTFIDSSLGLNSTNYINLTNFYDQMSLGDLQLLGDEYHIILPETQQWYAANNYDRRALIEEALTLLDPQIDYSIYDNWGSSGDYSHTNSPNGTVDMIFAVFRYIDLQILPEFNWNGEASLGGGSSYILDGVTIKTYFGTNSGSGVTCKYNYSPNYLTTIARHEFAHWLLGGSHPYSRYADDQHYVWALLRSAKHANAYERERLGWITVNEISSDIVDATMGDYITMGDAYKYHPPNGDSNEYFYFENHQKISIYDDDSVDDQEKGIYILHQKASYNGTNNIRCLTSSGCYTWDNPFWVLKPPEWGPGPDLPAYRILTSDPDGENNRDALFNTDYERQFLYILTEDPPNYTTGAFFRGYEFDESFNENSYPRFTPYTNPNTKTWSGNATNFAMIINNNSSGVLNTSFFRNYFEGTISGTISEDMAWGGRN